MAKNIFWNLVFLLDFGGVIALALYALARWLWLIHRLDVLLTVGGCLVVLVLVGAAIWQYAFFPRRGVIIHGIHYEDFWSDD